MDTRGVVLRRNDAELIKRLHHSDEDSQPVLDYFLREHPEETSAISVRTRRCAADIYLAEIKEAVRKDRWLYLPLKKDWYNSRYSPYGHATMKAAVEFLTRIGFHEFTLV